MRSRGSSSQAHFNTDTPQKSLTRLGQWSEQLHRTPAGSTPNVAQSLAHSCLGHVLKIDGICTFSAHAGWPLGVLPTVRCKVPGNERMCARRSRNGLEWQVVVHDLCTSARHQLLLPAVRHQPYYPSCLDCRHSGSLLRSRRKLGEAAIATRGRSPFVPWDLCAGPSFAKSDPNAIPTSSARS